MEHTSHLWLFAVVVFGVVILPGLDMAFVLASSLTSGRRAGLAGVAGIIAGGIGHVAMGATGIAVLLTIFPLAFNALLVLGALYVAWIGISLLLSGATLSVAPLNGSSSPADAFRRGMVTSLLNPKAYVFMLAIFPQFFRREYGSLWLQAAVLSLIIIVTQASVYGTVALIAAQTRRWLESNPGLNVSIARVVGVLLMLAAAFTGYEGWREV